MTKKRKKGHQKYWEIDVEFFGEWRNFFREMPKKGRSKISAKIWPPISIWRSGSASARAGYMTKCDRGRVGGVKVGKTCVTVYYNGRPQIRAGKNLRFLMKSFRFRF